MSENINKSLLILKSELANLVPAENFLRNRDWKVFSTTSLKEALTYMIQHQPTFVLLSVDHPNKKIGNLAKAVAQAFPCCVVSFAENNIADSYEKLSSSKSEYLLYPPVTGPAVERTAHKFYKDMAAKGRGLSPQRPFNAEEERSKAFGMKGDPVSTQALLSKLLGEEGLKSVGSVPNEFEKNPNVAGYRARNAASGAPDYGQVEAKGPAKKAGDWHILESKGGLPTTSILDDREVRTRNHRDSIVLRGTMQALDLSALKADAEREVEKLKDSSQVACIVVESSRFSGYLVAAMGNNRKIDDAFIRRVRDRLFSFLTANGEVVSEEDSLSIDIKQVPFEDWAIECAEFLRKSVHQGNEVAMAFFPRAQVKAKLEASYSDEMVTISLDEISIEVPIDFNLYVYLPVNNKYVLYTPRGGKMYENQKAKLAKQGILKMHMMKTEIQDLNKYRAQNFLNSKVTEYENIKRIEGAPF